MPDDKNAKPSLDERLEALVQTAELQHHDIAELGKRVDQLGKRVDQLNAISENTNANTNASAEPCELASKPGSPNQATNNRPSD